MVEFEHRACWFRPTECRACLSHSKTHRSSADEEYLMFANDSSTGKPNGYVFFVAAAHGVLPAQLVPPSIWGTNEQRHGFMMKADNGL